LAKKEKNDRMESWEKHGTAFWREEKGERGLKTGIKKRHVGRMQPSHLRPLIENLGPDKVFILITQRGGTHSWGDSRATFTSFAHLSIEPGTNHRQLFRQLFRGAKKLQGVYD
jgi:hypothetical protein